MGKNTRKIHHTKRVFVQKKYRDALFRKIFSERSVLLELYNALNNTGYSDEKELTVYTIDDVIYLGYKNDVSFIVRGTLNLYEHQSILNPNMPLRNLFYISSEYQKMVDSNKLYSSTLLEIPAPHFVVFYNGTTKQEDSWYNYLSDSYHNFSGIPDLELKVVTLNIIQVERM